MVPVQEANPPHRHISELSYSHLFVVLHFIFGRLSTSCLEAEKSVCGAMVSEV